MNWRKPVWPVVTVCQRLVQLNNAFAINRLFNNIVIIVYHDLPYSRNLLHSTYDMYAVAKL